MIKYKTIGLRELPANFFLEIESREENLAQIDKQPISNSGIK